MRRVVPFVAVVALSSCTFDARFPTGARVPCGSDAECPPGNRCDGALKWCVASESPFSVTQAVAPKLGHAGDVFSIGLATGTVDASLLSLEALDDQGANVARFEFDAAKGLWTWVATGQEREGPCRLFASAGGAVKVNLVELGTFTLDFTGPSVESLELRVETPSTNPLVANGLPQLLTAGRPGSDVKATLKLTEQTASLPTLRLNRGGRTVPFEVNAVAGEFQGAFLVPAGLEEGTWKVEVEATDLAGNQRVTAATSLDIITTPPAPPSVAQWEAVVFHRAPWGTLQSAEPSYRVSGASGAAPGAAAVLALSEVYTVGHSPVDSDGGFEMALNLGSDLNAIAVRSVDHAGNVSELVAVQDQEWIISALNADAGLLRESGDDDLSTSAWVAAQTQPWTSLGGLVVLRPDGLQSTLPFSLGRFGLSDNEFWRSGVRLAGGASNDPRGSISCALPYAFAYDDVLGSLCTGIGGLRQLRGRGLPLPDGGLYGAATTWPGIAAGRGQALLLGGEFSAGFNNRLDEAALYDGKQVSIVPGPLPPARSRHAMAFDPDHDEFVVFGGSLSSGQATDDTWVFVDGGFVQIVGGPQPPARTLGSLGWDPLGHRMILAGGRFGDGGVAVDTWAFDGQHWQALDAGPLPNAPNGGRLLSVPGSALVWTGPAVLEGDRWASNRHTEPVARSNRAAGFEPDLAAVVIAGGAQITSICDYTSCSYAYDARQPAPTSVWKNWSWVDVDSGVAPVFVGGSLRWDRANKNLALLGETPVAIVPPNVFFPTEVARSNLAAWSLDGGWSQVPLPSGGPTSMKGVDFAVDSTGSLLAYGGVQSDGGLSGQTWALNDAGWRLVDVGAPHRITDGFFGGPARSWQLDRPTGNLIFVSENRTDAWNGGWTMVSTIGTAAIGRLVSADPRSGQVIALGPTSLSRLDGDWTTHVRPELKMSFPNSYSVPDEALSACAAPDGSGQRLVVVDTTHIDSSTRVLDFVRGRPRQEFVVPLAAARAPAGAELKHAKVRWLGGASGEGADGGLRPGFALMVRKAGQLAFVDGGSSSPPEAPGVAEFEFADSRTLREWLLSPEGSFWSDVGVSAQSDGINGQGEAVLTTQAIEFSLSWHRGEP